MVYACALIDIPCRLKPNDMELAASREAGSCIYTRKTGKGIALVYLARMIDGHKAWVIGVRHGAPINNDISILQDLHNWTHQALGRPRHISSQEDEDWEVIYQKGYRLICAARKEHIGAPAPAPCLQQRNLFD